MLNRNAIASMSLPDSDDYLRLQQVRDWLAGDFSMADITLLTLIDFGIFIGLWAPTLLILSNRFDRYEAAKQDLIAKGRLYPCYETAEELDLRRKVKLSRKHPPIYGREALMLTDEQKAKFEAEGRKPHWRFLLPNFVSDPKKTRRTDITWTDLIRGHISFDNATIEDFVIRRADGSPTFFVANAVDDHDMAVTHVIRGEDLINVTRSGVTWQQQEVADDKLVVQDVPGADHAAAAVSVEEPVGAGLEPPAHAALPA